MCIFEENAGILGDILISGMELFTELFLNSFLSALTLHFQITEFSMVHHASFNG